MIDLNKDYGCIGANWKKQSRRKKVPHQTPGKQKCETCQADWLKKYMVKRNRSYKHPLYGNWLEKSRKTAIE